MAKFCTKCGNQLAEDDFFCAKCGSQVSSSEEKEEKIQRKPKNRKNIIFGSLIVAAVVALSVILILVIPKLKDETPNSVSDFPQTSNTESKVDSNVPKDNGLSNNPELATKYIDFIKHGFGECGDINFAGYYLYDVDKDGCEELIIKAGTCEADAVIWFCKYNNGKVEKIGDVSGGHSALCGNTKEDGVTIHYGHMGVEWIDSVKIKNNTLKVTEVVSQREVEDYTEFDYCVSIEEHRINDMTPLENYGGIDEYASQNSIDIDFGTINTSVSAYLEDYSYSGGHYLSDWENSYFTSEDRTIYNLQLDGTEKNYYLPDQYTTITARGDTIVGISQGGFQVSDIDNTYQLLKWLGGNAAKLIEHDPEIIYKDQYTAYLKWEVNNGYMVIYTTWYQGLTDWKKSIAWNYCLFIK